MRSRKISQLATALGAVFMVLATSTFANDDVRRYPEAQIMSAPGAFLQWRNAKQLVVTTGPGKFALLDVPSLSVSPLGNIAPDSNDVQIVEPASIGPWKNTFPASIAVTHEQTKTKTLWFHYYFTDPTYLNPPHDLIDSGDGTIELYAADRADFPIGDSITTVAPTRNSRYAFYNTAYPTRMPMILELSASSVPMNPKSNYRWYTLVSRRDGTSSAYFLFFAKERFLPVPAHDFQGWSPFNAWWIDVKKGISKHLVLPEGPWIADARSRSPIRKIICAPTDCDDFRHYDIKVAGHEIFVQITADRAVLNDSTLGIYVFDPTASAWLKVAESDATLDQVSPDGSSVAINRKGVVSLRKIGPMTTPE